MVTLRVMDDKNGRIRLIINNNDSKGLQLQVGPLPPSRAEEGKTGGALD